MNRTEIQAIVAATVQLPELAGLIVEVRTVTYDGEEVVEMLLDDGAELDGQFKNAARIVWSEGGTEAIVASKTGWKLN